MDLDFTDEQNLLRETTKAISELHYDFRAVRNAEVSDIGYPKEFWTALTEAGLNGLTIDEKFGGSGLGLLDAVVVHEELGRHLAASAFFGSSIFSARLIEMFGTEDQRRVWLTSIASGDVVMAVAHQELSGGYDDSGVRLGLHGRILSGAKIMVPYAAAATHLLVAARDEAGGFILCITDASGPGVRKDVQKNIAGIPVCRVAFDKVKISAANVLGGQRNDWARWTEAMSYAAIVVAAEACGGAERMLDITVEHAKTRVQFGKPIGAFQALSHYMAELAVDIEGSKTLTYQAAWAHDRGRPWLLLAAQSKLQATDTFRRVTAVGTQIHGGLGFTSEADPQLFFRRAKFYQLMHWDPEFLERRIADLILDATA